MADVILILSAIDLLQTAFFVWTIVMLHQLRGRIRQLEKRCDDSGVYSDRR